MIVKKTCEYVAQLVEQWPFKPKVRGSSPRVSVSSLYNNLARS